MIKGIKKLDLREQYRKDARFRGYVDRVSATYKQPVEETLKLALVREAAKYYQEEMAEEAGKMPAANSSYTPMGECV